MKKLLGFAIVIALIIGASAIGVWFGLWNIIYPKPPLKIGILHSQTGTLAMNENRLINAELMAIDEINAKGGLRGRKLEAIIADGKSDEFVFEQEATRLITEEKVDVIIGCWSSASRKRVKAIVEHNRSLLLYPVLYEGLEESPNIVSLGATPNQTIIPAVTWCFNNFGKRFFLIGSDYIFSHAAHKIMELHIVSLGGTVVGQEYIKLGSSVPPEVIQKIAALKPDVICNTINGDTNISFFKELFNAGITSEKIPTLSFSIEQSDFKNFELKSIIGAYLSFTYYLESPYYFNRLFKKNFKKKYGADSVFGDASQSAYSLLHMWAAAYDNAGSTDVTILMPALKNIAYQSPAGIVYLSDKNQNCWQNSHIGKFAYNGELVLIWDSKRNIRPEPYPPYLTKDEWNQFITNLYEGWGKRWSAA